MISMGCRYGGVIASLTVLVVAGGAAAQSSYPTKPIHIVVPQTAGGPSDVLARLVGKKLSDIFDQPVIIDNKPGAGGNVGTEYVAKALPDGSHLLVNIVGTMAINESLYSKLPYSLDKELVPIGLVAASSLTLLSNPSLPVRTVQEMLTLARTKPNELNVGSPGNGSVMHLGIELLNSRAKVRLAHIPYKGAAPAITDLLGGHVNMAFVGTPAAVPLIKQGKLVGLATTGATRSRLLPQLPTMLESGLSDFVVENVYGVWVTAGTPGNVIARLNAALVRITQDPGVVEQLGALGFEARATTPEQHGTYVKREIERWAPIVKASGATPD